MTESYVAESVSVIVFANKIINYCHICYSIDNKIVNRTASIIVIDDKEP